MSLEKPPEPSDDQLMARVADGDDRAFEELVGRHQRVAWSVAHRYTGRQEDAADLVQDAFLAVLEGARRYHPQGHFRAWLLRILIHRAISHQRRRAPTLIEDAAALPDPANSATDFERAEQRSRIRDGLDQLPDRQRMALILRFYEELSYREIARAMNTTEKTVERLLHRGRERLRRALRRE